MHSYCVRRFASLLLVAVLAIFVTRPVVAASAPEQEPVDLTHEQALAAAITHPAPGCTEVARRLKLEDRVRLNAYIRPDGTVADVVVVLGNPMLVMIATDAVRSWRFRPVTNEAGQPSKAVAALMFMMSCKPAVVAKK